MSKHARPSRAVTLARTGARTGVVVLGAAALSVAAAPAVAGGGPGVEPQEQKKEKEHKKADRKKVVHKKKKVVKHYNQEFKVEHNSGRGNDLTNSNGLVNIADNNTQIIGQACNNFVPVSVLGGQVAAENFAGAISGLFDEDGNVDVDSNNEDDCAQGGAQQDGDNEVAGSDDEDDQGFRAASSGQGGGGGQEINNSNGLVNIADNNVQIPLQVCNNYVPVNVLGGQVTAEDFTGALSILQGGEVEATGGGSQDSCDQGAAQQDGDNNANGGGSGQEINNSNGLVNISNNQLQVPLQGCNNFVPVNVLGGQVAGENFVGAVSGLFNDDGSATADGGDTRDECGQGAYQQDGDNSADLGQVGDLTGDDD